MVDTVVILSCDFCGKETHAGKNRIDLNGNRIRMGEKTLRKKAENWGWLQSVNGNGSIEDFCSEECYEHHKEEQNKIQTNIKKKPER